MRFKVGDKVRLTDRHNGLFASGRIGWEAEIVEIDSSDVPYKVKFKDGLNAWCADGSVEPITAETKPEPNTEYKVGDKVRLTRRFGGFGTRNKDYWGTVAAIDSIKGCGYDVTLYDGEETYAEDHEIEPIADESDQPAKCPAETCSSACDGCEPGECPKYPAGQPAILPVGSGSAFKFGDKVRVSHDWADSGAGKENERACHGKIGVVIDGPTSSGACEVAFENGDSWYIDSTFLEPAICPAGAAASRHGPEASVTNDPVYKTGDVSVSPTGAVRSKDADNVRYDLITPEGINIARAEAVGWSFLVVSKRKQLSPGRLADEARSNLYESLSGLPSAEFQRMLGRAFMELAWADKMVRSGLSAADVIAYMDDTKNPEIPSTAYDAVARACHEGATRYGDWNWEKGFSVNSLLNHALKHISDWLGGDRTEDHLGHAMWNVLAAIHSYILWPHLNAGRLREPGCKPPQKEVTA